MERSWEGCRFNKRLGVGGMLEGCRFNKRLGVGGVLEGCKFNKRLGVGRVREDEMESLDEGDSS